MRFLIPLGVFLALALAMPAFAQEVSAGVRSMGQNVELQGLGKTLSELESRVSASTARLFKIKECHEQGRFFARLPDTTEGCKNVIPDPNATCTLPWGGAIQSGQGVFAFAMPSVPFGYSCSAEARYCTAGNLSGSYAYGTCSVQAAPEPGCGIIVDPDNPCQSGNR